MVSKVRLGIGVLKSSGGVVHCFKNRDQIDGGRVKIRFLHVLPQFKVDILRL